MPDDARAATLALLDARAVGTTVCPSEVARVLAGDGADWREAMPVVHAAIDAMVADGVVRLRWKGVAMAVRAGPYRIGRREDEERAADAASEADHLNEAYGPWANLLPDRVLR